MSVWPPVGLFSKFKLFPLDSSCLWNQFACSKNKCIAKQWLCDGEDDCGDGLDESEEICGKTLKHVFAFRPHNERLPLRGRI